ncbi:alpha/beta-hydrolase [Mucidula mucida]|nr:alpha/beta-hydrolase [Mucidula mucida]
MSPEEPEPKPISSELLQDLIHYFKYASSAYAPLCPRPNGKTLVAEFSNGVSDVRGYVARDADRKELVVALRGSASVADILLDSALVQVPLLTAGVEAPKGVLVHSGFLVAWNTVALQIITVLNEQLIFYPDFELIAIGHSLGGSIATLAAISLRMNFPDNKTRCYTYGAPRTGNKAFAEFFNDEFGSNSFRVVHGSDGVCTMIPRSIGYHHHGIEYWQKEDPASEDTTVRCSADGEDPRCSASVPSEGVNYAHMKYFGILATTPFCI